jgi:hypothetical protein
VVCGCLMWCFVFSSSGVYLLAEVWTAALLQCVSSPLAISAYAPNARQLLGNADGRGRGLVCAKAGQRRKSVPSAPVGAFIWSRGGFLGRGEWEEPASVCVCALLPKGRQPASHEAARSTYAR